MKNIINTIIKLSFILSFISVLFISCSSKDDYLDSLDQIEGEHEEPSKLVVNFKNISTGLTKSFVYEVPSGTIEPVITAVTGLTEGSYEVNIQFFSESGEELTDDIFGHDKDEHFVYYSKINNSNINISYADDDVVDSDNYKIGKNTLWELTKGNSPQIIYLIHQPANKDPNALSTEQIGGEIDMEAHFKIIID